MPSEAERSRSFEELYRRHRGELFRAALRSTGDRDEAEEVVQTAFLDAYGAWSRGGAPREPRAWLFAIAENARRRRYGARRRRPVELGLDEADAVAADAPTVRELRAALEELPERQRQVVLLRELGGLSYAEIATALDLSVASVQMLLFRARRALRGRLGAPLFVPPAWLQGTVGWLQGPGAPAARIAGAAGALALGLGAAAGTGSLPGIAEAGPGPARERAQAAPSAGRVAAPMHSRATPSLGARLSPATHAREPAPTGRAAGSPRTPAPTAPIASPPAPRPGGPGPTSPPGATDAAPRPAPPAATPPVELPGATLSAATPPPVAVSVGTQPAVTVSGATLPTATVAGVTVPAVTLPPLTVTVPAPPAPPPPPPPPTTVTLPDLPGL